MMDEPQNHSTADISERALTRHPGDNLGTAALDGFFERLRHARDSLLLLDYDGTLAPFHIDPALASPYPGVCEALNRIESQGNTRLVIISGRWTRDLFPLLDLKQRPEVWGSHGWERCFPDGHCTSHTLDETALQALAQADHWTESAIALGARRESKPACLAIHWRGLDAATSKRILEDVRSNYESQARHKGLELHYFDGGVELRVPGRTKADAVITLRAENPVTPMAYLGDDLTDEDAFRALSPADLGVLVRPAFRPTAAGAWLQPPGQLLEFLNRWIEIRNHAPA